MKQCTLWKSFKGESHCFSQNVPDVLGDLSNVADTVTTVPDAVANVMQQMMQKMQQTDDKQPDAAPLGVVVEHPVALLPDDVLRLLPHYVLHHALQLDR